MIRLLVRTVRMVLTIFAGGVVGLLNLILDGLHLSPQVPSRSWRLYGRLAFTGLCLFAVSGFYRNYLGVNEPLMNWLMGVRSGVRGALSFMDEHPALITFLVGAIDWLAIALCGLLVTWWVMRIPNYLPSITLCCIGVHQGRRLSSFLELSLVSSMPVLIAFTLSWSGPASLFALFSSLAVIWYLNIAMDETRVRTYAGRISSVHTSFFTPLAIPHRGMGLGEETDQPSESGFAPHDGQDSAGDAHGETFEPEELVAGSHDV